MQEATIVIAAFVGAQVRILHPIFKRVKSSVLVVFVFPVPGGPHRSSTADLWLQCILWRHARIALVCDSFNLEVTLVTNFSSQLSPLCAQQRPPSSSIYCTTSEKENGQTKSPIIN